MDVETLCASLPGVSPATIAICASIRAWVALHHGSDDTACVMSVIGGFAVDGTAELLQLAHLLRIGATTAREIAILRKVDVTEILSLADQAEVIAEELERIAGKPHRQGVPPVAKVGRH